MIRVAFVVLTSNKWIGGANYFKNLLYAISKIENKKIQPVLFFSSRQDKKIVGSFKPYGETITTQLLDVKNFSGLMSAILLRLFNRSFFLEGLFRRNNIQVVSHSRFISCNKDLKTINWIPDFQHIHIPEMFSLYEREYRKLTFLTIAKGSDTLIMSSNDAIDDYKRFYPHYSDKARVLHFVSQPNKEIYKIKNTKNIEKKDDFSGKFFFLPNQLWKHKNHTVVIKALNLLKRQGKEVLVVCTGYMKDYRSGTYTGNLMRYIKKNNLENNIKFLGLIDYQEVLTLMRHCVSIINPSLFEGWSSTVEEAKSIGKNMILSDLDVHKEQNPPNSIYFNPHNEKELAEKLWKKWTESDGGPDYELEKIARMKLEERTEEFGKKYQDIVLDVVGK